MTNTTVSRIAWLSTVFATGVALMATVDVADAGGHHNGNTQNGNVTPHFVITGQPASVKHVLPDHKERKERHADKKKKDCEKSTVPTPGCAINAKDPVGSVRTGGITGNSKTAATPSQTAGAPAAPKGPSPAATPVALSNGVTKSAIENGKGLTVTSNSPGTITVSNGTTSVTMAGGSLTLHGALSVSAASGLQVVHLANGDVSVAASPVLMGGSRAVPPGVGFGDDVKYLGGLAGNGAAMVATSLVVVPGSAVTMVGSVIASPLTGHPVKFIEDTANGVVNMGANAIEWASNLF